MSGVGRPGWVRMPRGFGFGFLVLGAVWLAWLQPGWGAAEGPLRTGVTSRGAVFLIFLLQGLTMPVEALTRGVAAWRLHLLIQAWIFGVMPAGAVVLALGLGGAVDPSVRMGLLFLGMLPTTISTAGVMTGLAGGSVAVSVVNTCVANVAGVVLVPAWVAFWTSRAGGGAPSARVFFELGVLLALPLALGQGLRVWVRAWADARRGWCGKASSGLIAFILYAAFANSFARGAWESSGERVGWAFASAAALLAASSAAAWWVGRRAGLERGDRIALFFCGTQKTVAAGIPMAQSIFSGGPVDPAAVVLPLMAYHLMQLVAGGLCAERFRAGSCGAGGGG